MLRGFRLLFAALAIVVLPLAAHAQGYTSTPELKRVVAVLKQRAAAGDNDAAIELGLAYFNGRIVEFGKPQGIKWLETAAGRGDARAAYLASQAYNAAPSRLGGVAKAQAWRARAQQLGDPRAADTFPSGSLDVQMKTFEKARLAADQNNRSAIYLMTSAYYDGGYGVASDKARWYYWQLRAENYDVARVEWSNPSPPALSSRARQLVAADVPRWRAGAEKGETQALYELGAITFNGTGAPRDVAAGLAMLLRAGDQGYVPAADYLSRIYDTGQGGVPKDLRRAVYWAGVARDRILETRGYGENLLSYEYELDRDRAYLIPAAIRASMPGGPTQVATADRAPTPAVQAPTVAAPPKVLEPRYALVVGNSGYGGALGRLDNPANDARLMAEVLRKAGFKVDLVIDADQRAMKEAIRRLGETLSQAGSTATGLFYFAGHGAQTSGVNYLLPVGAPIASERDLDLDAIAAPSVLAQMEKSGARTTILVLDACRNVPLQREARDGVRGFAPMSAGGRGSFIAYSAGPGETAEDGKTANSTFTAALAGEIGRQGQPIETTFRRVRTSVIEASKGKQTPWDASSLVTDFKFTP